MRVAIGYPESGEEREILRRFRDADPLSELTPVASGDDLLALGKVVRGVHVSEAIETYILGLTRATREEPSLALGASPRASLALYHTAQARAALQGRAFVLPDDVQALVTPVLAHRLIASSQSRLRGKPLADILTDVITKVPVPVEESWSVNSEQ